MVRLDCSLGAPSMDEPQNDRAPHSHGCSLYDLSPFMANLPQMHTAKFPRAGVSSVPAELPQRFRAHRAEAVRARVSAYISGLLEESIFLTQRPLNRFHELCAMARYILLIFNELLLGYKNTLFLNQCLG